jgi:hypothetical protein
MIFNKKDITKKNIKLYCHCFITILFVYIFIQFLTLKTTNNVYKFYNDYIMNKYCLILYICLLLLVMNYDKYTGILLFILIIGPIKCSYKEYFEDDEQEQETEQNEINTVVENNLLGVDDRFKMDDVKKDELLRQIKAQINFDPYKTNLSKEVISELYNKYFDNDVFVKLKEIDNKSKDYIASGKFNYIPKEDKVDYDIKTYENLLKNTSIGVNHLNDSKKSL